MAELKCDGNLNGHTCGQCFEVIRPKIGCSHVLGWLLTWALATGIISLLAAALGDALNDHETRIERLENRINQLSRKVRNDN
jgi:hypothetical protein